MPRYNKSINPSCDVNTTGWASPNGVTRVTGQTVGNTGKTTAGSIAMPSTAYANYLSAGRATAGASQTWTVVAWVWASVARSIRPAVLRWNNDTVVDAVGIQSNISLAAGTWTQVRFAVSTGTGTFNNIRFHVDFPTSGSTGSLRVGAVRFEQGSNASTLTYADGGSGGQWSWDGTAGSSTSTQSDVAPPTVNAGADATVSQGTLFTRTATEAANGGTITSRSWTVVSGPAYVGSTVGTAAALSWEPETPGAFVLRYSAANAAGTGADDVAVTVTEVVRALAAPLRVTASMAGSKGATRAATATLRLTAALGGAKRGAGSLSAPLRLSASLAGSRNPLVATLGLTATFGQTTSSRAGALRAPLPLTGGMEPAGTTRGGGDLIGSGLVLLAALAGERIVAAVRQVPARPSLAQTYQLVVVAFHPQASGPPRLEEVEAINWSGLSYVDELNKAQTLNAGCDVDSLAPEIRQRLVNWRDQPSEIWLYRSGRKVFAGPLMGAQVQGTSLSFVARGLLAYLDFMAVDRDLVFSKVEQTVIAATLVDQWQALEYGHCGIDTSAIPPTGVVRDATYLRKELHRVGKRVLELGGRIGGFDVSVDPTSRQLVCAYPFAGVDRSSGEDAIVFDKLNITSPNITLSAAPDDIASEVYGTGTSADGATIFGVASNEQLRARFGRRATSATFDGVKEQGTLDAHLGAMRDARSDIVRIPGPDTRVTADSDLARYDVGDRVSYTLHQVLSVEGAYRLLKRQVTAQKKTGLEAVSLAFI